MDILCLPAQIKKPSLPPNTLRPDLAVGFRCDDPRVENQLAARARDPHRLDVRVVGQHHLGIHFLPGRPGVGGAELGAADVVRLHVVVQDKIGWEHAVRLGCGLGVFIYCV